MTVVVMPDGTHVEMPDKPAPPTKGADPIEEISRYFPYWRAHQGFQEGLNEAGQNTFEAAAHPIESVKQLAKAVPKALGTAAGAVTHPIDTVSSIIAKVKNLTPEQVGKMLGTATVGAATGEALGPVGQFIGKTAPKVRALLPAKVQAALPKKAPVNPDVKKLAQRGVSTMTPAQRGGGALSTIEQKLESTPIVGDIIKKARQRPLNEWNRAEVNESLATIGEKPVPKSIETGHDALDYTYGKLGDKYDSVLSKMKADLNAGQGAPIGKIQGVAKSQPGSFREALEKVRADSVLLPADQRAILGGILDKDVIGKFPPRGKISGRTVQDMGEVLRDKANTYRKSPNPHDRELASKIDEIRDHMDNMLERQNPAVAPEFQKVRKAYAQFSAAAEAAKGALTKGGVYTPAQKLAAIKRRDISRGKGASARGKAPGQQDALAAHRVLGTTVPTSGTSERGMVAMMAREFLKNPAKATALAASLGIPTSVLYSEPVMKLLQRRALRQGVKSGTPKTPYAAGLAATQFQEQPQQ